MSLLSADLPAQQVNYFTDTPLEAKINILIQSPHREFLALCRSNKDFSNICNNYPNSERIYEERSKRVFSDFLPFKPKEMKWKDFYERIGYFYAKMKRDDTSDDTFTDEFIRDGKLMELKILANLKRPILPDDVNGAEIAASNKQMDVLKWLYQLGRQYTLRTSTLEMILGGSGPFNEDDDPKWENSENDRLEIIKLVPADRFDSSLVNLALEKGYYNIVKYFSDLDPPIVPVNFQYHFLLHPLNSVQISLFKHLITRMKQHLQRVSEKGLEEPEDQREDPTGEEFPLQYYAKVLAETGNLELVKFMAQEPYATYPNYISSLISGGNINILEWLRTIPIMEPLFRSDFMIDNGIVIASVETQKALAQLNPPILPSQAGINQLFKGNQVESLQFYASLTPPLIIDKNAFNNNSLPIYGETLQYIADTQPNLLTIPSVIRAIENQSNEGLITILLQTNIPRIATLTNGIYPLGAAKAGNLEALKTYVTRGAKPDIETLKAAIVHNQELIVRYLVEELNMDPKGLSLLTYVNGKDNLDLFVYLLNIRGRNLTNTEFYSLWLEAVNKSAIKILNWLYRHYSKLYDQKRRELVLDTLNYILILGKLAVLRWFWTIEPNALPSITLLDNTIGNYSENDELFLVLLRDKGLRPGQEGFNQVIDKANVPLIEFLLNSGIAYEIKDEPILAMITTWRSHERSKRVFKLLLDAGYVPSKVVIVKLIGLDVGSILKLIDEKIILSHKQYILNYASPHLINRIKWLKRLLR